MHVYDGSESCMVGWELAFVCERKSIQLVCIGLVWVDDGDRVLFEVVFVADIAIIVDDHIVRRGHAEALLDC